MVVVKKFVDGDYTINARLYKSKVIYTIMDNDGIVFDEIVTSHKVFNDLIKYEKWTTVTQQILADVYNMKVSDFILA